MSSIKIFDYSRTLPSPFDTLKSKKIKVSSTYGDGTEATLSGSVIKAVHSMIRYMEAMSEGAVGTRDNLCIAEYKSAVSPDAYHLVIYNKASGALMASVYDKSVETFEQYLVGKNGRDGAAILTAMMPALLEDEEFNSHFLSYKDHMDNGYPDLNAAVEDMAMLCDNAYRRVKDETCAAHLKVSIDKAGNVLNISSTQLDSGNYEPTDVVAGEFTIFTSTTRVTVKKAVETVAHSDFVGKYPLDPSRKLSALEQSLVPQLPSWYIIPEEVVDICKHASITTGKPTQMRNFLLRGPAGTGKTMGAKAIAAGLNLPYMKYTCSAGTEIFDFIGMIFPETDSVSTGDAELDKEKEALKAMGGINYANVAKLMHLPDLDDMNGVLPLDKVLVYQEILYRIDVLESCQLFVKTAPVTTDTKVLAYHYQMWDVYIYHMYLDDNSKPHQWIQDFMEHRNITELTRMVAVECIDEIAIYEDRKIEVSFTHWQDYSALSEQVREYYQENHKEVV